MTVEVSHTGLQTGVKSYCCERVSLLLFWAFTLFRLCINHAIIRYRQSIVVNLDESDTFAYYLNLGDCMFGLRSFPSEQQCSIKEIEHFGKNGFTLDELTLSWGGLRNPHLGEGDANLHHPDIS